MPTYVPPKKNTEFIFSIGLPSQANTKIFQANPTLAAGDFKVAIDNGTLNNLAALPTVAPAGGKLVKIVLSAAEMNGDNIQVVCSDAAGAEWCDVVVNIQTTARQIDDLAYPATSGRSMVVDAAGLVDATAVKVGPTGAGTAQTAGDIIADTNDIQARLPAALVGGRMDASVGAMATDALTAAAIADGAIDRAAFAVDTGLQSIRSNTAQAGAAASITLDASASATTDFYKGATVYLTGGTGAGQSRICTAYNGTTKVATITPSWATNPDATSTFAILPHGDVNLVAWLASTPGALVSGEVRADVKRWNGTNVAVPTTAGVPEVDITHVAGTLQTAGDIVNISNAIKSKTDSLTFTVAGKADAHITHVNNVLVGGAGTSGNPWGPA